MTLIENDLRLRVAKLLDGSARASDLTTIFLSQRAKSWASPAVIEVGDFIAHRDERVRGVAYKQTKAAVMSARAHSAQQAGSANQIDLICEATQSSLDHQDEQAMLDRMGFGLGNANSMLGRCRAKQFGIKRPLNRKEKALVEMLMEPPQKFIFSPSALIEGLCETLQLSGLIQESQFTSISRVAPKIILFAISQMHGTKIVLPDGYESTLHGSGGSGTIKIWANFKLSNKFLQPFQINFAIFDSGLNSLEYCPEISFEGTWAETVELKDDGRLAYAR